ncbi:MAG TPA: DUF58 domain-containing protein [Candidatus Omnitrophota bacterium]|nr:DUF58 domain-containing protein [Candidatus Omnitrophota bacterium]
MISADILKKIKRIQITTSKMATDLFSGEYKSVFKGRGLEFVEVREYLPGDEVRSIDWNVTARMGRPFIKKFIEERQLTIMFLLDLSRSTSFGTVSRLKRDLATEVCAVLAAAATSNNDRVGLIGFTDGVEVFITPRKGKAHVFKVIREALSHTPRGSGTDIAKALRYLDRVVTKSCVVFLVSDFYTRDIKQALSIAGKRHDLVAVHISDPRDMEIPDAGVIELESAEGRGKIWLDSSDREVRERYRREAEARMEAVKRLFYSVGMDAMFLRTDMPYEKTMISFFAKRKMRK